MALNGRDRTGPEDDDFDPKHFVKRVETELIFDSDGEPEAPQTSSLNRKDISSVNFKGNEESMAGNEKSSDLNRLEGSFNPEDQYFNKESKINFQYQDLNLKGPAPSTEPGGRKFSGIYEDDYFMFVEDYDNFIGQFVSDEKVKIVRGFLNHNEHDRIYYTRMAPNDKACANFLVVHGFGHTVKYLDVGLKVKIARCHTCSPGYCGPSVRHQRIWFLRRTEI
jgi:hypothetical protein